MHLNKLYLLSQNTLDILSKHKPIEAMGLVRSFCSFIVLLSCLIAVNGQGTRIGFYSTTCPNAETIVRTTVTSHFGSDPKIAPGLLRMHFHDCFVQGCDGSVLLSGANSERTAGANFNLRGFEVIEDAKRQLEAACPGVVSCADILTLAARDSVALVSLSNNTNIIHIRQDTNNMFFHLFFLYKDMFFICLCFVFTFILTLYVALHGYM